MTQGATQRPRRFEVPCTVEVEQSPESLHAHVVLQPDVELGPGDRVQVHGPPIQIDFGERMVLHRQATVVRAGWLGRWRARLSGNLECTELLDVSFTERMKL